MTVLVCAEGQQRTTSAVYVIGQALLLGSAIVQETQRIAKACAAGELWKTSVASAPAMEPAAAAATVSRTVDW